jgi:organic radical activating enzyme
LCDTSYTSWFPDDEKNIGDVEIDYILKEYLKAGCRDVVITGGEPTMYPEELALLCSELKRISNDIFITIETNGTSIGDFVNSSDLISISPKLTSSVPFDTEFEKMHEKNRINAEVLRNYNIRKQNNKTDIQWKFVYTGEKDIEEILKLQTLIGFENKDIYLMPEGITEEDIKKKRIETIDVCKKNKFNYTDRLHILIWGNKRGT